MKSKEYFVALLSSYINEVQPPEFAGQDADWNMVLYLAEIHSVQTAVYIAVSRLKVKPPNFDAFKEQFNMCVSVSVKQEYCMDRVIKGFTENNIKHILVKGYVLKDYYPNSEARSFGDVDILINEDDRQKSDRVLKGLGFKFDEKHYAREVWTYNNGVLSLEIHTKLIHQRLFNDFDYEKYFIERSAKSKCIKNCTYQLSIEDHFLFILVHLAKHFYNCGVGIRMIMDIAVYIKKFGGNMDFDYINSELEKMKLSEFARHIYCACENLFGICVDAVGDLHNENEYEIVEYILNHGVFGFDNKNIYDVVFHKNDGREKTTVLKRVFVDYDTLKRTYYWFRNCPKILTPYGWVRRIFIHLADKEKRNAIFKKINSVSNAGEDAQRHNDLLKNIGLK